MGIVTLNRRYGKLLFTFKILTPNLCHQPVHTPSFKVRFWPCDCEFVICCEVYSLKSIILNQIIYFVTFICHLQWKPLTKGIQKAMPQPFGRQISQPLPHPGRSSPAIFPGCCTNSIGILDSQGPKSRCDPGTSNWALIWFKSWKGGDIFHKSVTSFPSSRYPSKIQRGGELITRKNTLVICYTFELTFTKAWKMFLEKNY